VEERLLRIKQALRVEVEQVRWFEEERVISGGCRAG